MHEMWTIAVDDPVVCLSVSLSPLPSLCFLPPTLST